MRSGVSVNCVRIRSLLLAAALLAGCDGQSNGQSTVGRWNLIAESQFQSDQVSLLKPGFTINWTGREAVVWSGQPTRLSGGIRPAVFEPFPVSISGGVVYNPATDTWRTLTTENAPRSIYPEAVWTGDEMLVWNVRRSFAGVAARLSFAEDEVF